MIWEEEGDRWEGEKVGDGDRELEEHEDKDEDEDEDKDKEGEINTQAGISSA